jgi:hypothetical protein
VAVTGLWRSGKTVFVSLLVRNIFASALNPSSPGTLYGFEPEIIGIGEALAGADDVTAFPKHSQTL